MCSKARSESRVGYVGNQLAPANSGCVYVLSRAAARGVLFYPTSGAPRSLLGADGSVRADAPSDSTIPDLSKGPASPGPSVARFRAQASINMAM